MARPDSTKRLWSSSPVIDGIWTSAIKQAVVSTRGDARKSSAEGNASTVNPSALMKPATASRADSSSSTTEIIAVVDNPSSGASSETRLRSDPDAVAPDHGRAKYAQALEIRNNQSDATLARRYFSRFLFAITGMAPLRDGQRAGGGRERSSRVGRQADQSVVVLAGNRQCVNQPFNCGSPVNSHCMPSPGSRSFPRSKPHDGVRGGHLTVRNDVRKNPPSADSPRLPAPPSRRGHHRRRERADRDRGSRLQAACAVPHSNTVPSVQMQCRMMASLRAIAIFAFFRPTRFASRMPQTLSADQRFVRWSSTLAASNR